MQKGYITFRESADFMNLPENSWQAFLDNYRKGDLNRVAPELRNLVPSGETRFLTGFSDQQLEMIESALKTPIVISEERKGPLLLLKELRVLMILGVVFGGRRRRLRSFCTKVVW